MQILINVVIDVNMEFQYYWDAWFHMMMLGHLFDKDTINEDVKLLMKKS